ncbi:uncharacterized protein LOC111703694 isoform X1 [Eurytemora carolleeae]|uniref:uncharacterized protein LOC111703694 isoform X1 n=1 Tax=Eurytemora carolleeae TaxID=1294199 RepID=UPI000C775022|nr:uncharacterized protein LOC111703694 isoform X1 [Eurytemora carolleeae]|eukprot:XP_023331496.1 uncharacterized protein LOC111703694 isoform X1 [Eurytemora affinis]
MVELIVGINFDRRDDQFLNLNQGDKILVLGIIHKDDNSYYLVENSQMKAGLVPFSFLENTEFPAWFNPELSRIDAERYLMRKQQGDFFIRHKQHGQRDDFSVSVR